MKSQGSSTESVSADANKFLDAFFRGNPNPTEKDKDDLSKFLNLPTKRIILWFCKRRNQASKEHWRENFAPLIVENQKDPETTGRGLQDTTHFQNTEDMSEERGYQHSTKIIFDGKNF